MIFLIIIKNTLSKIEMPNTVLGDASRLIPLTVTEGYYRINLERNIMDTAQLKRIADAIEEILRLVKKDMEPRTKKKE